MGIKRLKTAELMVRRDPLMELPDGILSKIISLLPLREAIRTSILSKSWKSIWTCHSHLKFDSLNVLGSRAHLRSSTTTCISKSSRRKERRKFVHRVDELMNQRRKGLKMNSLTAHFHLGKEFSSHIDDWISCAVMKEVEGLIVGGTTGEGQLMSWDEHIMLIGHTVNCFGGSIRVIGNTGSNSTREAIHATEQGFAVGMHAALHINPYYGKTSIEGMISHFDSVLSMGPSIIYNVPSRTGQDIPARVIHTLTQSPNLAGIKECVGNDRVKQYTDNGIVVWTGNDDQLHDARWDYGATGVISVTSNLIPGLIRQLLFEGKNPSLNSKLMPLIEWLFQEPNPIPLNTALAQLGVIRPVFRLPYVPLPMAKRVEFVKLVKSIGRENLIGDKDVQVVDDDDFILLGRY